MISSMIVPHTFCSTYIMIEYNVCLYNRILLLYKYVHYIQSTSYTKVLLDFRYKRIIYYYKCSRVLVYICKRNAAITSLKHFLRRHSTTTQCETAISTTKSIYTSISFLGYVQFQSNCCMVNI
jgi:hypothetical protein